MPEKRQPAVSKMIKNPLNISPRGSRLQMHLHPSVEDIMVNSALEPKEILILIESRCGKMAEKL